MVMIWYTAFMLMLVLCLSMVNFAALRNPDKVPDLFAAYYDEERVIAQLVVAVVAAILEMVFTLMLILLGINLANPVPKDAIIVLAVINTVTVFFTVPVLRRNLYRKRWYLALTTAYTLVEFTVVVWIFIYRLGEMF